MTLEKKRKIAAIGLSVLIVLLPVVIFAQAPEDPPAGVIPCSGADCDFNDLTTLVNKVIDFLLVTVAFPISAALFAYAGFLYLTAAGDEGQVKKAHGVFLNVFWGLIFALAAWLIIDFITNVLTGSGRAGNPFS